MDLRKLKTLIDLVSESGVAELEIREGEDHVRIVNPTRASAAAALQPQTVITAAGAVAPAVAAPVATAAPAPEAPAAEKKTINSPMKLLNEIEAETNGVIREILVENGSPVEFGQPLFVID